MRPYLALIEIYLKLALREKVVLFFNYVLPLGFLFGFGQLMHAGSGGASQVVTMVLIIGILGNGLYGAGIRAVVDRETNILRRYKVAPITPAPILVASMVTGWLLYIPTFLLIMVLTHFLYGMPVPERWGALFILVTLGSLALRAIGLIVASVVNSVAESNIIIQLMYLPMLFLSGATVPLSLYPVWAQTIAQFLPPSYLFAGLQGTMLRNESLWNNISAVAGLATATVLSTFISIKLFRWEKDEKLPGKAKLWIAVVFIPFILLGAWQAHTQENITRNREYERMVRRNRTQLIRGARIVAGDGTVLEHGSVLLQNGKIQRIIANASPDAKSLNADGIDAFGKTLLPGLIELAALPDGGALKPERAMAAYLYSGVTAINSPSPLEAGADLGPEVFHVPLRRNILRVPVNEELLERSLVQQIVPADLLERVRTHQQALPSIPGASVHARLQALVQQGTSPADAIASVTRLAAQQLGAADRIGAVKAGYDGDLLLVDGDPLTDISATERISDVFFKGERLDRSELLKSK